MIKILNVGCGRQTHGTHFIDLYPQRKGVTKCNVETQKFPFPDEFFDEVYSESLLEHLKSPHKTLTEMYRVLKRGGKLVVITDNAYFWGWHILNTHYGGYERVDEPEDRHYALFTTWHLKNHFRSLGLSNINTKYMFWSDHVIMRKGLGFLAKQISKLFSLFWKRGAYPQIKIIGTKT